MRSFAFQNNQFNPIFELGPKIAHFRCMNYIIFVVKYAQFAYFARGVLLSKILRENKSMPEKDNNRKNYTINYIITIACVMLMNIACLKIGTAIIGIDYATFYTTGKMVLSGSISNIYNMSIHHRLLESMIGVVPYFLEWVYPPTFLFAIVPFAIFPFQISYILWMIITFVLAALSVYLLTNRNKIAPFLFFLFPGTFLNIRWGQNGFLTAALLGFGIFFTETSPLLSGLMFGLLTFKPQIAIVPFIVLLALKKWKVFGWACLFAFIFAVLSGLIFGFQPWLEFIAVTFNNTSMLTNIWAGANWGIPTLYTSLRCMGLNGILLSGILAVVGAASIFACVWVWKLVKQFSMRAMSLVLCIFLTLPYISLYDCSIIGIPFTLLFFERIEKKEWSFHPLALVIIWILPLICLFVFIKSNIQLFPFVLMAYLAANVWLTYRSQHELSV